MKISASEALYGFAGWITSRKEIIKAGETEDASVWADLVEEWINANELEKPRQGIFPDNIKHPD